MAKLCRSPQHHCKDQPRLLPIALNRAFGNVQRFSNFLLAIPTEVAHLCHLCQTRVRLFQILQCLVYSQNRVRMGEAAK